MFLFKNKLNDTLIEIISKKYFEDCRVIIICKNIPEFISKKIKFLRGTVLHEIQSLNIICAIIPSSSIERLIEYPQIKYIIPDSLAYLCGNSILSSNRSNFYMKFSLTGKNIGVGIIDSGVYPHPDLTSPHYKIKNFIDLINDYKYPYDDNGHGTFISGLICGSGKLSSKELYRGTATDSHIFMIKAFNSLGHGYISDIIYGIETLIDQSTEYNIKVICLPFEVNSVNSYLLEIFSNLFAKAAKKGIVIITPSGNNGNSKDSINGIALLENCITVGGLDTTLNIKSYKYSSSGPCGKLQKPDLSAACVNICSLNSDTDFIPERNGMKLYPSHLKNPYTNYTGTSCAAAYVSGICALLYEKSPDFTYKDIKSILQLSCRLINIYKWQQGAGMIDINRVIDTLS